MRLLIDEFLPIEEVSAEAQKEKLGNAKPPLSKLHYWWARRPLIASRAALLGALISTDALSDYTKQALHDYVVRQLGIRDGKRAHTISPLSGELSRLIRDTWGEMPLIYEPFGGGGSIPFEALRLGCPVEVIDYNPVAFLILKATLEYPVRYGERLYRDVEEHAHRILDELRAELCDLYPSNGGRSAAAYVHSWQVRCPMCGGKTPLALDLWLCRNRRGQLHLAPHVSGNEVSFTIEEGAAPDGNVRRGAGTCLLCGATIPNERIREDIRERQDERLLAVVRLGHRKKMYEPPTDEDFLALERAKRLLRERWMHYSRLGLIPMEDMPGRDIHFSLYLSKWYQLFSPRQLLVMLGWTEKVRATVDEIARTDREYAKAVGTYLSCMLAKHIDRNCRATKWDVSNEQIGNMMGSRRPSMAWKHAEVNPFVKSSGTLMGMVSDVLEALRYSLDQLTTGARVRVSWGSARTHTPKEKMKLIITDPPYYNNVQYGELSEVFFQFHKRTVGHLFADECPAFLEEHVPTEEEMDTGARRGDAHYNRLFNEIVSKLNEVLDDDGRLVMFFTHKSARAWSFVVEALQRAGFTICAQWPIHTESSETLILRDKRAVYYSLIMSARKREGEQVGMLEDIYSEVEERVRSRLKELESYGLSGSGLLVAATGVALEVLTSYSHIESYSGKVDRGTLEDVIELAQAVVSRYIAERRLGFTADPATTLYVHARLQGLEQMAYDEAHQLMRVLGVDESSLLENGLIHSDEKRKTIILQDFRRGISEQGLRVMGDDPLKGEALIDYVHRALRAYVVSDLSGFSRVLDNAPHPREHALRVLEVLAEVAKDPRRANDMEAKVASSILKAMGYSSSYRDLSSYSR